MARGPAVFKQADVTRALKGAVAAGLDVGRVEVDAVGKIVIYTKSEPTESETPLEKWKREHASTS